MTIGRKTIKQELDRLYGRKKALTHAQKIEAYLRKNFRKGAVKYPLLMEMETEEKIEKVITE
jgi:hypothetical protein